MALLRSRHRADDSRRSARRIALIYLAVGAAWILLSDRVLALVVHTPSALTALQTVKGWFWVGLSALLIYLLVAESLAALRRREQWFRALIEQTQDVVLVMDQAMTVRYASQAAQAGLGRQAESLAGARLVDLLHPDDVAGFRRAWSQLLATPGGRAEVECRCRQGDGGPWRVLEIVAHNLTSDPAVEGIVVNARDVTERQQLRQRLTQVEHLEAVGQLAAGIAHDFNNILSVVLANAGLLRQDPGAGDAEREALLDDVLGAARSGAQMVKKLLGYSRQTPIVRVASQLRPIVEDIVRMARRLIPETIEIELRASETTCTALVDATVIQQVVLNLVTNARDAMPVGGTLRFELGDADLDAAYATTHPWTRPGRYVRLAVVDTGAGMDEATRKRAFEPFFTTKPAGAGTGMGLAMAYGLVKQHQGSIEIESEPGRGTTVALYFPVADTATGARESPAPGSGEPGAQSAGTVLLVEDEEALLRSARRALEAFGYTVVTATNGEEGLRLLEARAGDFDLVLSDVVLPKLGGRELYHQARERGITARFVFVSGYAEPEALGELQSDPQVTFLHKPWTLDELRAALRQSLAA
jgi:PAS domain S-box-containing protein